MLKEKIIFYIKKGLEKLSDQRFTISFFIIFFLIILFRFIFFVNNNTVDIPFWDQFGGISDAIIYKNDFSETILYQHNEHRIGVGLIIMKVLANISNWSQVLEIRVISFLIIVSSIIFSYIKYRFSRKIELFDILIPIIILNIFQAENLTWGFQIAFVLPFFFLSLWLLSLNIVKTKKRYFILTLISLLSTFSSFHGLILPIITIGLVSLDYFKYNLINIRILLVTTIANIIIPCLYFIGYVSNFQTSISILPSINAVKYFSVAISNGFFYPVDNYIFINTVITLTLLYFFSIGLWKIFKSKEKNNELLMGLFIIFFSLTFTYIISVGRSSFGTEQALSSRYVTFTMLSPLGLFFIFSALKHKNLLRILLLIFMIANISLFTNKSLINPTNINNGKRQVLNCYKSIEISELNKCYEIFTLHFDKDFLNQKIVDVLRFKKINTF